MAQLRTLRVDSTCTLSFCLHAAWSLFGSRISVAEITQLQDHEFAPNSSDGYIVKKINTAENGGSYGLFSIIERSTHSNSVKKFGYVK